MATLETLRKILSWDLPAPAIMLEDDGEIELEWLISESTVALSIGPSGNVNWAILHSYKKGRAIEHGTDIERVKALLEEMAK